MVSGIRNSASNVYTQNLTADNPDVTVNTSHNSAADIATTASDDFVKTEAAFKSSAATTAVAPAATAKTKKPGAVAKLWDKGMTALIPLTKKEIAFNVNNTIKFDEAEKYKLDIKADVDLGVGDKALTQDQAAYFKANAGSMLLTSKLEVSLTGSATSPCYAIESGTLMGGMSINVQMPAAIDPKTSPTKEVFTRMWDRLKSTTLQLPYTAKMAEKLPQGTVVSASFVVAGGISLSAEDQTAAADRRTQVTVNMERGADGKIQLTVTKERIDNFAMDLDTGDLINHFRAGYERKSKVDRTTVEVFNIDLNNEAQMAALQKALPWTGGKYKLIPQTDTSKLKELGCEDTAKAAAIKKRELDEKLDLSGDVGSFTGALQLSRKYADGKYTIANMVDVKYNQNAEKGKVVDGGRTSTVVLPDKDAKLSPKQATATATRLAQCSPEAWRTAPEGAKLTQLVTASLALGFQDKIDNTNDSWQLDPSGSKAYTYEVVQTKDGPTVKVIEQDKLALLSQLKGTNVESDGLCQQIQDFGIYEALEDFMLNDGKKLKDKYSGSYNTIKDQLADLVSTQLSYNYRVGLSGSKERLHQVTFGPFALADNAQKEAFQSLTSDLNMKKAISLGLMQEVVSQKKLGGAANGTLNNYQAGLDHSADNKRQVRITHGEGQKLTLTVTDTKITQGGVNAGVNNLFGENIEESDIGYNGSKTRNTTTVKVYQLDLNNPAHLAAWEAAVSKGKKATGEFELDFTAIDTLNVRDAAQEKITVNQIFAGEVKVDFKEGPVGTSCQFGHNYKDGNHTITNLTKFKATYWEDGDDEDKKSLGNGITGSTKVVIPDKMAELSNRQVQNLSSRLEDLDLATWQEAATGTKYEAVIGNSLEIKAGDKINTSATDKSSLWRIDPNSEFLTTIQVVKGDHGPSVTMIKERKVDILASFKHTRAKDLAVSDAISSFGLYNAIEDFLQNEGKNLQAKFGATQYAAISTELTALIKDQKAKNIGIGLTGGSNRAHSTSVGPFDLEDPAQQLLFRQAASGQLTPAVQAGFLASVSTKKVLDGGATVDFNATEGTLKGTWDKDYKIDFQHNNDGTLSLVVTEKKLTDTTTGTKIPDLVETIDVKFNTKLKDETTQIYVYDLDPKNPAHQAALESFIDKIGDNKNPQKAIGDIADLGVRNKDKEKLINKTEATGDLGFDLKKSEIGAAFTMGRKHDDGKYTFTNLFQIDKDWSLANLPIAEIGSLTAGFNILGTTKVEVAIPDNNGALTMGEASSMSTKLTLTEDDIWKEVPLGTAVTHLATGELSFNGNVSLGKDISFMDGLNLSLKGGITVNPSTNKVLGNTVTKTENGLEVTFWQEDISKIALGLEAKAGLIVELNKFGVYNAITDWLKGGEGLRKKLGTAAYEAADKALSKLLSDYLNASLEAKVSTSKEHKEKATFGPFDLDIPEQKAAFNKLVRFYNPNAALEAGLLESQQIDKAKVKNADFELKISALELAAHSEMRNTESDFTIKLPDGAQLTCTAVDSKFTKSGKNAFKGEEFTYNWNAFAVEKTSGDSSELIDVVFQGAFTMSDKRTMASEAADWENFCHALNLTIDDDNLGKKKVFSGYGKGDGKIQFGASISAFNDTLKNWQPLNVRNTFMQTAVAFENMTVPPSEADRSASGAMPLDTQALRLAADYLGASSKKKSEIVASYQAHYPNSHVSIDTLAEGYKLLEEYWTRAGTARRKEILQEYQNLGTTSNQKDLELFLASYLIICYGSYQHLTEEQDVQMWCNQYERLTGRNLYQDTVLVESADLFMTRMDEIHSDWQEAGGSDATSAMNEVVKGITSFGKKVRPWNLDLGRVHEHAMFVNMAAFLNLVGQNNNAVEVSYKGQRFTLSAHGEAQVQNQTAETVVQGLKKEISGK